MTELFLKILNMSFSAGWMVLAVLVLRLILHKAPKWIHVLLWGTVAVRLACPFTVESVVSLIPSKQVVPPSILLEAKPQVNTGVDVINSAVNPILSQTLAPAPGASVNPVQILVSVGEIVWLVGVGMLVLYGVFSYLCLKRQVRDAVLQEDNVYVCSQLLSPFILGFFRPRIYLPAGMPEETRQCVTAHELSHIRRRDHWWKPLGYLLLALHWFNPFLWLAYILLCRDIEMACDEKVIRHMERNQRADYSQALLQCSISRRTIAICPLAFGEVSVKQRIKSVLNYKKPGFWLVLVSLALCAVLAVCFLTDPKEEINLYDGKSLAVWIQDGDSADKGEIRWCYFDIRKFERVILPGANAVSFSLNEITEVGLEISFETPLLCDGESVRSIVLGTHDHPVLMTPTVGGATWYGFSIVDDAVLSLPRYMPLEHLPGNYSLANGKADGCVVMENGDVTWGKDIWWAFYNRTLEQSPASVRYITYFTLDNESIYSPEYIEEYKDSYPRMYVHDLVYDGSSYKVSWYENGQRIQREYQYLLRFQGEAETAGASFSSYERYVLTNRKVSSWIEIMNSLYSSQMGVAIDHMSVYTNLHYPTDPTYGDLVKVQRKLEPYMQQYRIAAIDVNEINWTVDIDAYEVTEELETLVAGMIDPAYVRIRLMDGVIKFTDSDESDLVGELQQLLDELCAFPTPSSNPGAYIQAHPEAYSKLLACGEDTLRWCFQRFLKGGETGLQGHIMALACEEIMLSWGEAYLIDGKDRMTGQDWFGEFLFLAKEMEKQYSNETLRAEYPGAWIVLSLSE